MPYRNVYEEQQRSSFRGVQEEPERDPKKIAEIYRSQLPSKRESQDTRLRLENEKNRRERALTANRGIKRSIIDR